MSGGDAIHVRAIILRFKIDTVCFVDVVWR